MIYVIENSDLKVSINSFGSELWSIFDKRSGIEHLWQGDKSVWPRRAPTLFPNCGRLRDNQYIINGEKYLSKIHGFARDFEHQVVEQNSDSITFLFSDNHETLKKYPYKFSLYTTFKLDNNQLTHSFKVENINEDAMYFSIGYHTGYKIPFDNNHSLSDYSLVFENGETPVEILCNDAGLLSGENRVFFENQKEIPLTNKNFPSSFILSNLKSKHVSIVEKNTGRSIKVGIEGFPYVVFWGLPEEIKFICIEPWHGLPDLHNTDQVFENKPGIVKIGKGDKFSCSQTIEIIK